MQTRLEVPDAAERADLGAFVARAVRLDQGVLVRLRVRPGSAPSRVDVWAETPFDALVTRSVTGTVHPADVTVDGNELLAALAVVGGPVLDPGPAKDMFWRGALPPVAGWQPVDDVPAAVLAGLADRGVTLARENPGPRGAPPASLLDQAVITVQGGESAAHGPVPVPLRCLFALSGMGFLDEPAGESDVVRVSATGSWLRLDARYGAVVRRRFAALPLLVAGR
jgi:hypothetical protein